jgi:membrane-associated phospholipid phosphatase
MQVIQRSPLRSQSWLLPLLLILTVVTLAHLLDWWTHTALANPRLAERDLGRMLRVMGFLPFWALAAVALALCDAAHRAVDGMVRYARALLLFFAAGLGGLAAEVMKLLARRERPNVEIGEYVFRGWTEQTLNTGGLGLASSHAGVALGAAFMLARLFPRARYVWYTLGVGCAYSRVAAGAHFLSDVVVSGVLAFLVVALLWRRFGAVAPPATAESPATLATPAYAVRGLSTEPEHARAAPARRGPAGLPPNTFASLDNDNSRG